MTFTKTDNLIVYIGFYISYIFIVVYLLVHYIYIYMKDIRGIIILVVAAFAILILRHFI